MHKLLVASLVFCFVFCAAVMSVLAYRCVDTAGIWGTIPGVLLVFVSCCSIWEAKDTVRELGWK